MKKVFLFVLVAGLGSLVALSEEGGNLLRNPGFEDVKDHIVRGAAYLQGMQKKGCDLAEGPVATLPRRWIFQFTGTTGKIRIIEGEPGKEVYSGKYCLYVEGGDKGISFYQDRVAKPGSHFSVYARGKGRIYFRDWKYSEKQGKIVTFLNTFEITEKWDKYEGIYKGNPEAKESFVPFFAGVMSDSQAYLDDLQLCKEGSLSSE